jgi:dolichyldiphosphatase
MFVGQLVCEALNFVLKRLIKEERPPRMRVGKGYGMPSSHAQFAFFWAVALGLFLVVRHRPKKLVKASQGKSSGANEGKRDAAMVVKATRSQSGRLAPILQSAKDVEAYAHQPWSLIERIMASVAALALASAVAWSRIYLGYHTPKQVMAGCIAGSGCAVGWFAVTYALRETGLLAWALDFPVVRWFRIRDLVVEEDLCQAGWEKWEDRRLAREAKKKE